MMYNELIASTCFSDVIKGSEQSLHYKTEFLDRESYCCLSHRTYATFADQREIIYGLFQIYLKLKQQHGEYDATDRYVCIPLSHTYLLQLKF